MQDITVYFSQYCRINPGNWFKDQISGTLVFCL
uniref:Uncharacterized protein n=1 Tax=Anguilla anguilla TaxID=7936 RepID=A0A0E9SWH1_ANGAN